MVENTSRWHGKKSLGFEGVGGLAPCRSLVHPSLGAGMEHPALPGNSAIGWFSLHDFFQLHPNSEFWPQFTGSFLGG